MKRLLSLASLGVAAVFGAAALAEANCGMMMGGPSAGCCSKTAFLLLALAAGYWVLTLAEGSGSPLKIIGRVVGWLILVVAAGGLICSAVFGMCRLKSCRMDGGMPEDCMMSMHKLPAGHPQVMMPPSEETPSEGQRK